MKHRLITHALTTSLLFGGLAFAQETSKQDMARDMVNSDAKSTNFHRDSEIIGMDLWTTVATEDGEKVDIGDIRDFVVDSKSGRISHVVISSGGVGSVGDTLRPITWDQIKWSENEDGEKVAMVDMSEKAFDAIAEFDAEKINMMNTARPVDASAGKDKKMVASTNHLCSDIAELDVYGPGEEDSFTSIGECVINCDTGTIAYLTLEANDETYLIPFSAFQIQPISGEEAGEEDIEFAAWAPHGEEALKAAPTIDEDTKMTAQNPTFRKTVDSFYATGEKNKAAMPKKIGGIR
ncbi:PRC-barrel domain protein [Planctomycetes bacterium Poly30]|uniref:PRC-barrel domain protein n=1 Tax=Saltatorellus ferox TaxID=2528018 RepID=A0A518EYC9_9BACT|nr:PRC-barrel domain protein [Planctomycetes bacterium Poly30]